MKKLFFAALLGLATVSASLLAPQTAKADRVIDGNHVTSSNQVAKNYWAADHPHAYADGYRQGEQSFRNREAYKPRKHSYLLTAEGSKLDAEPILKYAPKFACILN